MGMKKFIAIAGNMGVGKSALTALLSERLGWEPFYEAVDDNPYLADFYKDMKKWSFHSQMFFLARKLRYYRTILDRSGKVLGETIETTRVEKKALIPLEELGLSMRVENLLKKANMATVANVLIALEKGELLSIKRFGPKSLEEVSTALRARDFMPSSVIQDRTIYEDAEIFAENLYRQGYMSERDYRTYREVYEAILLILPPPDLIVYLRASVPTLKSRITIRGRHFERDIDPQYLEQLNDLYEEWARDFDICPLLIIPADEMDFVKHSAHLEQIASRLAFKKFPELFKMLPHRRRGRRKIPAHQREFPGWE